jgi:hypothetical protein
MMHAVVLTSIPWFFEEKRRNRPIRPISERGWNRLAIDVPDPNYSGFVEAWSGFPGYPLENAFLCCHAHFFLFYNDWPESCFWRYGKLFTETSGPKSEDLNF